MPTPFAEQLSAQYGPPSDYPFTHAVQLKKATELSTIFGAVTRFEPWTVEGVRDLLKYHPVAIWTNLQVTLAPRAGIYGRMCTFYGGWAAAGTPTPTTVQDMVSLHNPIDVTYGGTGDPGTIRKDIQCSFDMTMQDILKTPYGENGRPVFFYAFTEAKIIDNPGNADRFMLTFTGTFQLKGRY